MSSPDLPFVRKGGDDQISALHNRVSALERIKFLTGVDLRDRSTEYKQLIDCELYVKYFKNEPLDQPISEEWCQRVAEIVRILEKKKQEDLDKILVGVPDRIKQLHTESKKSIPVQAPLKTISKKKWYESIKEFFFPEKNFLERKV